MLVGIDIDGVLRQFHEGFFNCFFKDFPQLKDKAILDKRFYSFEESLPLLDAAQLMGFTLDGKTPATLQFEQNTKKLDQLLKKFSMYLLHERYAKEVYLDSAPIPGAIEAVNEIIKPLKKKGHDVTICSCQVPKSQRYTFMWLGEHNVQVEKIQLVRSSLTKFNHVDIQVDDAPKVLQTRPENKTAIKVWYPYNDKTEACHTIQTMSELPELIMNIVKK